MSEYALVSPLQPTLPAMDRINSSLLWKFAQLDVNGDDVITSREL
uniref:EF-hand domain-containing protein n=1 Tax=Ciona savignyi TaxID=51511 RepID=H2ZQK4_CIOSA